MEKTPSKRTLKIPPSPFLKRIGYGTGVAIYEMVRSPVCDKARSPWALKKIIKNKRVAKEVTKRLNDEAEVLRKLKHPNIVGFRAYLKGADGRNILAMEECSSCLGDLIEDRREIDQAPYSASMTLKVAADISKALNYLHNKALLLHCDVKSYNILIKGDFEICKLCDFGVCLPLNADGSVRKENNDEVEYEGTLSWMAPEVLAYPPEISTAADIYAFGLVLWEMIALSPPIDSDCINDFNEAGATFDNEEKELDDSGTNFDESIEKSFSKKTRQRPDLPDIELGEEYNLILEIFYRCTFEDPKARLTSRDLCNIFNETE